MKAFYSKILFTLLAIFAAFITADAQNWSFSTLSEADKALCKADANNWILGTDRYCYVNALDAAPLTANGTELAYANGLKFTAVAPSDKTEGKAKIRLNYGKSRLELNGSDVSLIIPGLKAGQKVTVSCETGKSGVARGLNVTNLTPVSGSFNSTSADAQTNVGTVTADGDVTLTTTAGMYIYSIQVSDNTTDPVVPSDYHNVGINVNKNQARLTLTNGDINYYNTAEVALSIDKVAGTVTVRPVSGDWSDVYTGTVSNISFAKAQATEGDGQIDNQDGHVQITEAKGWLEAAYIKWNLLDGAKSYNVYVKGGNYADYTKIDDYLVRNYGTYGRADAVGLVAGEYSLKIIPVDADGKEISDKASEATAMNVTNYSREGFAHFNRTEGIGAYNNDGSLKSGAKVLYVTAKTAKTISTTVNTGKEETVTGLQSIIDAYQKGKDTTPIAFRIIGKVSLDDLDKISSSSEGLQIKGKGSYSTMNITLEGIGDDATVYGFGFLVRNASSVEFRNFAIMRCLDDALSLDTDNSNIWIHNMDFFYGKKGGAADQAKGDGTVDIKGDSKNVTVAYNHFWDNGKASMCGMTSESGENWITYHHNWFDHSDSRHARIRTMSVHLWNNYYDHNDVYGLGATSGSSVFAESNYFRATKRPMMSSGQGTDATGNGTFSGENGGLIKAYGNVFAEKPSNFSYITYNDNNTSFDAYEVASPDEQVPSSVKTLAGGTSYNNFDTDASKIYSYTADAAADVPAKVTGYKGAGRMNQGDLVFTIPDETVVTNGHQQPWPALATLLDNYKSSFVSIFGDENASGGGETGGGETGGGETGGGETGGGETGGGTTTPVEGTILCSFDAQGNPSASQVTLVQKSIKKDASVTVDGVTYANCIKMDSKETITVTVDKAVKMTVYFGFVKDAKTTVKLDGTATDAINGTELTFDLTAGSHTLTKGSGETAVGLIKLVTAE